MPIEVTYTLSPEQERLLSPEALAFVEVLARHARQPRADLLAARAARQARIDAGELPDFLPETAHIRAGAWRVAPIPPDLQDRRVEITGPTDRKMVINALNSGASVFMADFEDATSPTLANLLDGQINLYDAIRRTITFVREDGKQYHLIEKPAVLIVRPRGWHLQEKHLLLDGEPLPGGVVDFGLYFFHNARELLARGSGPYFYLPKLESHHEARLWNELFVLAQETLGIPQGTIRATVLIETILATFEADEILYELRDHSAGLNCGRWDYIFSYIKKLHKFPDRVLPDRAQVTMTVPFMRAYAHYVVKVCHKRGIHAMGGMAAQIPIKNDPEANAAAFEKVRADKLREVSNGHDGTWVAHPGLVPLAREVFDAHMPAPNQIDRQRDDVQVTAADLLTPCEGTITEHGISWNIRVGVEYLAAWLNGNGCVPLYNLMEDAATAEISRSQVWQWLHHRVTLADGSVLTPERYGTLFESAIEGIRETVGDAAFTAGAYRQAAALFDAMIRREEFTDFLTLPAYELLA